MAAKKATQARAKSVSIEVVSNGYKVSAPKDTSTGLHFVSGIGIDFAGAPDSMGRLRGEFVFQDFAGLTSFLRKSLTVPSA